MKNTTIKSVAIKTTKVTGATLSLVWSALVFAVAYKTVQQKTRQLMDAIAA